MKAIQRLRRRGFTLVELMIVVAIIGVLAALAIYGVSRYLASSKTSEAKDGIGGIARAADQAFKANKQKATLIPAGQTGDAAFNGLCNSAPAGVPQGGPPGKVKYQPKTAPGEDFNAGDEQTGWACLKFYHDKPIIFQYNYKANGGYLGSGITGAPVPGAVGMEASTAGDLDGDNTPSFFSRVGEVRDGQLVMSDVLFAYQSEE